MGIRRRAVAGLVLLLTLTGCGQDDPGSDDPESSGPSVPSDPGGSAGSTAVGSEPTEVPESGSTPTPTPTSTPTSLVPIDDTNAVDVAAGEYVAYDDGVEIRVLGVAEYDGGQGILIGPEIPYRVDLELRNPTGPPIPVEVAARMGCGEGYASEALDLLDPSLPALPETVQSGQTVPFAVGFGVLPDALGEICVLEMGFSPAFADAKFLVDVG